jgi:hypothetical protein
MKCSLTLANNCVLKCDLSKIVQAYMCGELIVWAFLSYTAIYYGKMFDYRFTDTKQFAQNIDTNFYYSLVFGHLNLTNRDVKEQRLIQGEMNACMRFFH